MEGLTNLTEEEMAPYIRFLDVIRQYRVENNLVGTHAFIGGLEFLRVERFIRRILRLGGQPIDIYDIREIQTMKRGLFGALHMLWRVMRR
uniref:Transferred entry: 1.3.98.3 n=1 Tax=Caenorhabditis tropicalis TaxID=1561998 RepID=A0A1I7UEZ9_9PELO